MTSVCSQYSELFSVRMYTILLTYSGRGIPTRRAFFGEGSGPIHLSRAQCRNDYTILAECSTDKTGINNCQHSEDAGVICHGKIEIMPCCQLSNNPIV